MTLALEAEYEAAGIVMKRSHTDRSEAPVLLLCDADALPSLPAALDTAASAIGAARFSEIVRVPSTPPCVALAFPQYNVMVYRSADRCLLLVEQGYENISDDEWRAIRDAEYETLSEMDVTSGVLMILPLNEDLAGIEITVKEFRDSDLDVAIHGEDHGGGVVTRVAPGQYEVKRSVIEVEGGTSARVYFVERRS
jgi:hypothetical protein